MTDSKNGKKRAWLAAGSLLTVGVLATAAAFTDFANLNLGNGTDDSGFGGNNDFNIQVVATDGNGNPIPGQWQEANSVEGVNINVPGADLLTPGDSASVSIPFRNESPVLTADMSFSLQDRPGKISDATMKNALRYTVALDGEELATNATQSEVADLDLGQYASEEAGELTITVFLPDQGSAAANEPLKGKTAYVQAHFDATSVAP